VSGPHHAPTAAGRNQHRTVIAITCRVVEKAPKDLTALTNRAYCLRKLDRLEEAVADYTAVIAACPPSVRSCNNRAFCLARLGRYREAIEDYSTVISLDPGNAHAYHNR
jgi:tetratricopeptide (TPR) repeat protein